MKGLVGRGLALGVLLATGAARAELPLALDVDPCVEARAAEIERLLAIELGALPAEHARALREARVSVRLGCRDELTTVGVDDPITGKRLERPVRLRRAAPEARARLLALAIVELLVASWTELQAIPTQETEDTGAPAPEARRAAQAIAAARLAPAPEPPRAVRLLAIAGGSYFLQHLGAGVALGLRVGSAAGRRLDWAIDARVERATAEIAAGRISFLSASIAPALLLRGRWGPLALRGGLGARAGVGQLSGTPANAERFEGRSFTAPWLGALAQAAAEVTVSSRLCADLVLEGGHVLVPLGGRIGGVREVGVEGAWLGATLGVGWTL